MNFAANYPFKKKRLNIYDFFKKKNQTAIIGYTMEGSLLLPKYLPYHR